MRWIRNEKSGLWSFFQGWLGGNAPARRKVPSVSEISFAVRQLLRRMRQKKNILVFAFRSFRGHIRNQSAKGQAMLDYGPAVVRLSNGLYRTNTHTAARNLYTKKLQATLPWVDCQDCEMFLMGFDAGSRWHSDSQGSYMESEIRNDMSTSWPNDIERKEIINSIQESVLRYRVILSE